MSGIIIYGINNNIDHAIISRYNKNSGIALNYSSSSNTLNYCYSNRNCNIKYYKANGFYFHDSGMYNFFTYCFSWDNSVNGFSSI